ncbi:MAG: aminotransferase class I/II-fold pyridoxal phosphate-dependent enzyme [Victivallales bacterium]|nr:aminotransferase class I/II-fold pyridoxal phosphate-dependent enzyme [Victivallales bacterium]
MYRMGQEEVDEVAKVLLSKQLFRVGDPQKGHLREVERFEREWSGKIGTKYSLLMSGGGTAAIVCGLAGMGIGPGDEVIVPAYTWLATATSVLTVGAIPVLAEIDETLGLDPDDFEKKISPQTRAVIPVHMCGRPANLGKIIKIAKKHKLKVLEDSCQMVGGSYKGRRTGSWGDAGAFSFNFFKIISSGGEGGALVTNDRKIFERAFIYHDSGSAFRPMAGELAEPIFVAQQYRADEVMGAIARIQAQRLDGIIADLRRVRKQLESKLSKAGKFKIAPSNDPDGDCGVCIVLQFENEHKCRDFAGKIPHTGKYIGIDHSKHVYTQWEALRSRRIMHHPDMNPFLFEKNRGLRMNYDDDACPRSLEILKRSLFIPLDPDMTDEKIKSFAATLKRGEGK